ncbi:hypothetical protein ACWEKT_34645 [Nocardia takedensis]
MTDAASPSPHDQPTEGTGEPSSLVRIGSVVLGSLPPVEARPDEPLPGTSAFIQVFAGTRGPTTALLRYGQKFQEACHKIYELAPDVPQRIDEAVALMRLLVNREASAHLAGITVAEDAPTYSATYGQMVFWLAWKWHLFSLRREGDLLEQLDVIALHDHGVAFNRVVTEVRAGRMRFPAGDT